MEDTELHVTQSQFNEQDVTERAGTIKPPHRPFPPSQTNFTPLLLVQGHRLTRVSFTHYLSVFDVAAAALFLGAFSRSSA